MAHRSRSTFTLRISRLSKHPGAGVWGAWCSEAAAALVALAALVASRIEAEPKERRLY